MGIAITSYQIISRSNDIQVSWILPVNRHKSKCQKGTSPLCFAIVTFRTFFSDSETPILYYGAGYLFTDLLLGSEIKCTLNRVTWNWMYSIFAQHGKKSPWMWITTGTECRLPVATFQLYCLFHFISFHNSSKCTADMIF